MYKERFIKGFLIAFAFVLTCLFVVVQNSNMDKYNLSVGSVAYARIKSPEEIINQYQTDILKDEARKQVAKIYKISEEVNNNIKNQIEEFFNDLEHNRVSYRFMQEYNSELAEDEMPKVFNFQNVLDGYDASDTETLITMEDGSYSDFKNAVVTIVDETLAEGVSQEDISKNSVLIKESLKSKIESRYVDLAFNLILDNIEINKFIDEENTKIAIDTAVNAVIPKKIKKGQTIIDEGDVVTEETFSILKDLGYIDTGKTIDIPISIGYIILVSLIFIAFFSYIYKHNVKAMRKRNIYTAFFIMYIIAVTMMFALSDTLYNVYIPLLFIFWVAVLINHRLAYSMTIVFAVIGIGIAKYDTNLVLFVILSGVFIVNFSSNLVNRIGILRVVLYVCTFNASLTAVLIVIFKTNVTLDWFSKTTLVELGVSIGSTIIVLFLAFGAMPIWEAIFGILTPTTLIELTKPSNPLLRKMILEAPGTYHHSLVVANLAEEAAIKIGANSILARVGSYYHDVGKMVKPRFFAENQDGINIHDRLSYSQSVEYIKGHVTDGIKLAKEYKIPQQIIDFIPQHHGNTLVKYFYLKALEENPDVDENDFRYNGVLPKTRETAIVMMADTVEAAVRSIIKNVDDIEEVRSFVNKLIDDKMLDGQFNECNITLAEIEIIKDTFFNIFKAMYHDRISYPEEKDEEEEEINEYEEKAEK